MKRVQVIICCIGLVLSGCFSPKAITVWEAPYLDKPVHDKIMVVAIIKDNNDSLRMQIEDSLVSYLVRMNYQASSAFRDFGPRGLSDMSQEVTYLKLCDQGIDAVLTITLIDESKQASFKQTVPLWGINYYYYNRIWNYRKIQADLALPAEETRYLWESILFDLTMLEPLCVVQSKSFTPRKENNISYLHAILDKMKKNTLKKSDPRPYKAF